MGWDVVFKYAIGSLKSPKASPLPFLQGISFSAFPLRIVNAVIVVVVRIFSAIPHAAAAWTPRKRAAFVCLESYHVVKCYYFVGVCVENNIKARPGAKLQAR